MVKRKRLDKYLNKRWDTILDHLKTLKRNHDQDAVHDLRLNAKKIKALFNLLKKASHNRKAFSSKKIKPLFKHAGNIRTADIHIKTLQENRLDYSCLIKEQRCIMEHEYEKLADNYKPYKKNITKLRKKYSKNLTSLKDKDVKSWYASNGNWLTLHFLWPVDGSSLHECRKRIKNLIYTIKVLPNSLRSELGLNIKYLDKLQEIIGLWHDIEISLNLIKEKDLTHLAGYKGLRCKQDKMLQCILKEIEFFNGKMMNIHQRNSINILKHN
jgi:CHAD domain-containing protein